MQSKIRHRNTLASLRYESLWVRPPKRVPGLSHPCTSFRGQRRWRRPSPRCRAPSPRPRGSAFACREGLWLRPPKRVPGLSHPCTSFRGQRRWRRPSPRCRAPSPRPRGSAFACRKGFAPSLPEEGGDWDTMIQFDCSPTGCCQPWLGRRRIGPHQGGVKESLVATEFKQE
jgi:hypothetical protein